MRMHVVILAALSAGMTAPAFAQIRASERAAVSQTVDGTVITVSYSRPQMRGRPPQEDGVIHIEHMWTPGANWATTLEVNKNVTLNGHPVPAGTYTLWAEPTPTTWTMHLHPNPRLFHTMAPKASEMKLSFEVTPTRDTTHLTEVLTFDFPAVRQDGATLRFRWGDVTIPFDIGVESTMKGVALTEAQAAPYVGGWTVQFLNEVNEKSPEMRVEIMLVKGRLRGVVDGPSPFEMEFVPQADPHTFYIAFVADGKVFDVETSTPIVFEVQNGRATRWAAQMVPGIGDGAWIWGSRK